MESEPTYDLVVIGAGPAGLAAASEAAGLGLNVALIDRGRSVGGAFVHTSAIPARVLRDAALRLVAEPVRADGVTPPTKLISEWLQSGIESHLPEIEALYVGSGVEVIRGLASFRSAHEIEVADGESSRIVRAENVIIASGSRPRRPPEFHFDGSVVCDSSSVLQMSTIPSTVLIAGAGYVGCEYACTLARIGVEVTLVDRRRSLLRTLDGDIAKQLLRAMGDAGIRILLGEEIEEVRIEKDVAQWNAVSVFSDEREIVSERILVALGREPTTRALRLETAGIDCNEHGWIEVDGSYRTSCPHVYAIGDVIGQPLVGGASAYEGRLAARTVAGQTTCPASDIPISLFTIPEISMVGMTEEACRSLGIGYSVGIARYSQVPRSHLMESPEGLLKIVFRREDRVVLGVHIIGAEACELIHLGVSTALRGGTIDEIAATPFSFPTLSQLYDVAARDGLRRLAIGGLSPMEQSIDAAQSSTTSA